MVIRSGGAQLNIAQGVREFAVASRDQVAVIDGDRRLTYGGLADRSFRVAQALLNAGLKPGSRVGLHMGNRLEYFEISAGIAMAGMVLVPINPRSTAADVSYILHKAQVEAFILDEAIAGVTDGLRESIDVVWSVGGNEAGREYEQVLAGSRAEDPQIPVNELDTFCIMFTSGTTGKPKGVQISHRSRTLTFYSTALDWGLGPQRRSIAVAPMYHGAGFAFGFAGVATGGTVSVLRSWDPEKLLDMAERDRAQSMFLVPTHAQTMRALAKGPSEYNLEHLETLYFNAAALPRVLKEWVFDAFPKVGVHELYGSTEAGVVTDLRPVDARRKIGSVGHPWFMTEVRVVDEEGNEVPAGTPGELYSRSPYLMNGYLDDPEATEACTTPDGFLSAGDVVVRDEEGFIYIVDRKKDMIVSGGVNVFPREIEEAIASFPGVHEVAVVGLPDEKWGESITAVVVPSAGVEISAEALQQHIEPLVAGYKRPRRWEIAPSLPRNAGGKIIKREVVQQLAEGT